MLLRTRSSERSILLLATRRCSYVADAERASGTGRYANITSFRPFLFVLHFWEFGIHVKKPPTSCTSGGGGVVPLSSSLIKSI